MHTKTLGFLGAVLFTVLPAAADVIYDNGVLLAGVDGGYYSDVNIGFEQADDFVLQAGMDTITDIHWWGAYAIENTPETDIFTVTIYADDGGIPGASVFSSAVGEAGRTDTGADYPGFDIYSYSIDISPLTLTAGATYWLSVVNNTSADTGDNWVWVRNTFGGHLSTITGGASWDVNESSLAFYLTNDNLPRNDGIVPEPASMALLGLGLTGLAVRARRNKA